MKNMSFIVINSIVMKANEKIDMDVPEAGYSSGSDQSPDIISPCSNSNTGISRNLYNCFQQATEPQLKPVDFNKLYKYEVVNTDEKFSVSQHATPKH